ncbi:MAG: TonB-dependent receptor [Sphingomonas sp.]
MLTRRPDLGEVNGYASIEVGDYGRRVAGGALNVPIGDSAALRGAFQIVKRDGYFDDGSDDEDSQSFRLTGTAELTPELKATLFAHYNHLGGRGSGAALLPLGTTPVRGGIGDPAVTAIFNNALLNRILPPALQPAIRPLPQDQLDTDIDSWGVSAEIEWHTALGTLTVVPAFEKLKQEVFLTSFSFWVGGAGDHTNQEQFSLEARFASDEDQPLRWLVGGYYLKDKNDFVQNTDNQFLGVNRQVGDPTTEALAGFGQLTLDVASGLRLSGGLRYTIETKSLSGWQDRYFLPAGPRVPNPIVMTPGPAPTPDFSIDSENTWRNATWKLGVEWDAGRHSLVYANVGTGFKAGGFFYASSDNSYEPEKVVSYTIGTKNRFLDNRLQLNAEAFYLDYTNQQFGFVSTIDGGGIPVTGFQIRNVGASSIKGAEAELTFLVTRTTELQLNAQYLDSKFDEFVYPALDLSGQFGLPPGAIAPQTGCPFTRTGGVYSIDCGGRPLIQAPEWTLGAAIEQTIPLPGGGEFVLGVRSRYESERWTALNYVPAQLSAGHTRTDLNIAYHTPGDTLELAAFVNNVENEDVPQLSFVHPLYPTFPVVTSTLRPPRTFGVRARANF